MSSIDVIIPCYRYGRFLRECVESVLSQSGVSVRALIIDDESPDNTPEVAANIAASDARVTYLRHRTNKGHIATYNEGIEWVSADYLLLLSADDYLLPGALVRATALMDANPETVFAFGNAIQLEATGAITLMDHVTIGSECGVVSGRSFIEFSGSRNMVPTPTAVVRTRVQKEVGGYRSELPHSGDMEMWLRLAARGSVGMIKSYQAVYRRHTGNMSLSYMAEGFLPDVQQRKAAMDSFFQSCGGLLPRKSELENKLHRALADDALDLASSAFNENKMKISDQLAELAISLCPDLRTSLRFGRFALKKRMGARLWHALAGLRGFTDDLISKFRLPRDSQESQLSRLPEHLAAHFRMVSQNGSAATKTPISKDRISAVVESRLTKAELL